MKKYNSKILHLARNKITRVPNLVRNGNVDSNDIIANERHTHGSAVVALSLGIIIQLTCLYDMTIINQ
jgi:hypothetical protein